MSERSKIEQAGQRISDFVVNDPELQDLMEQYVAAQYEAHGVTKPPFQGEEDGTIEHSLYYTWATEWHVASLAEAIRAQNGAIDKLG
jgi:hypothetical protein